MTRRMAPEAMAKKDDDEALVDDIWRHVTLGRCWFTALLIATGHRCDAELELEYIAARLPRKRPVDRTLAA